MKRERNPDSDSFEMLLDAMCNTFGGIIFIALLIALLSNSASSVSQPDTTTPPAPARPTTIETPIVHDTNKHAILMTIYNQKLYPLHDISQPYDDSKKYRPISTADISTVSIGNIVQVTLLPNKGKRIDDDTLSGDMYSNLFANIDPSKEYVVFFVNKYSFAQFIKIKQFIKDFKKNTGKKIECAWSVCTINKNGTIFLGRGNGPGPQGPRPQ